MSSAPEAVELLSISARFDAAIRDKNVDGTELGATCAAYGYDPEACKLRCRASRAAFPAEHPAVMTRSTGMTLSIDGQSARWLLLGTAVLQACAPPLIGFDSAADDPPIVPPAPFFAVWGVVVGGCLVVAVWGLPRRRATSALYRHIQVPLTLVQVAFTCWLLAAGSSADWLTAPIFAGMLAGLAVSLRRVLTDTAAPPADHFSKILLSGVLGVYAGWSTAALWINAATLLPDSTLSGTGGLVLQCAFVTAAAGAAAIGSYALRGQASYTLTAAWALTGVTVSAVMAHRPALAATAVAGLILVGAVALQRRANRTPRRAA